MGKQTKILIGLAVLGVAAYLYFRPKDDKGSNTKSDGSCLEGYIRGEGGNMCFPIPFNYPTTPSPSAPPATRTYVFLKDTEITEYMGGNSPTTKKFKKGDSIDAYIYKVQSGRCNQEGEMRTGEAITFEDCNKLRTNLPSGMAIDIPYDSVKMKSLFDNQLLVRCMAIGC